MKIKLIVFIMLLSILLLGGCGFHTEDKKSSIEDGEYHAAFTKDALVDGKSLSVEIYTYDKYNKEDIEKLIVGDTIQVAEKEITITKLDTSIQNQVTINDGEENGGVTLLLEDDQYRTFSWDDAPIYYSAGSIAIPLSLELVYIDESDLENPEGITMDYEEFIKLLQSEEAGEWYPNSTVITVNSGEIVKINVYFVP